MYEILNNKIYHRMHLLISSTEPEHQEAFEIPAELALFIDARTQWIALLQHFEEYLIDENDEQRAFEAFCSALKNAQNEGLNLYVWFNEAEDLPFED